MSSSLPDVADRPASRADVEAAASLARAVEKALTGSSQIGTSDLNEWWNRVDFEHDSWVLEEGDRIVALGWLDTHFASAGGFVDPAQTGRGLGSTLVERAEGRARELGLQRLKQWAFAADASARALFEVRGYSEVRRFWEMAIELREPPPPPPVLPGEMRIETFRPEDARAFHAASNEAFAEEWGFTPMPFEEWWEFRSQAEDFDPSLWFLVRDGDEIAAICRCHANMRGGGFVGLLGVRPGWRERGLGLALLQHAFGDFYRRGDRRVSLGVDSENPTGATRLYERAGMHVEGESVVFERELS
jgi:mycothiol synthase